MQSWRWVGSKGGRSNELNRRKNLLTGKKTSEMEQVPGEVGSSGLGGPTSRGMRAFAGMQGRGFLPEGGAPGGHLRGEAGTPPPPQYLPGTLPFAKDNSCPAWGFQASAKVGVLPGASLSNTPGAQSVC